MMSRIPYREKRANENVLPDDDVVFLFLLIFHKEMSHKASLYIRIYTYIDARISGELISSFSY